MRHRVSKKHFGRDTNHRKALLRNLVRSLVENGEVTTTVAKAKETRRLSDKIIAKASKGDLNTRRNLHKFFGKRDVVNTLVDRIAPAMKDRISGFTRLVKVGKRRGDNSEMAKLSLVKKPERLGDLKSGLNNKDVVKPKKKTASKKKVVKNIKKAVATPQQRPLAQKKTTAKVVASTARMKKTSSTKTGTRSK